MRFACLHLPGFVVQAHVRAAPHLQGTSFAVLAEDGGKAPRVIAVSRSALAEGVKLGLTGTQARALAPGLRVLDAEPELYASALAALGEALLALSVTVEVPPNDNGQSGHLLALVPPGARGASFGERLIATASSLGFLARVGIADDRFTAWAATQAEPRQPVRAVPAGGSAAFLAPLPLELLPLDPDIRRTLTLLGVKKIGDFAELPPPSVGRRWARDGVDVQTLARGEDRRPLHGFVPVHAIAEAIELEHAISELEPLAFVLRPLCERVATRLAGRGKAAAKVAVTLTGERGRGQTVIEIAPARPTGSARTLVDLLRAHLSERALDHAVERLAVEVREEGEAQLVELDLFTRQAATPGAVDVAVARLRAVLGAESVSGARLADRHRPEAAWEKTSFTGGAPEPATRDREKKRSAKTRAAQLPRVGQVLPLFVRTAGALRLLDPPAPVDLEDQVSDEEVEGEPPASFRLGDAVHHVASSAGPTRLEAEWWTDEPLARDYFEVVTHEGGHYWIYRDRNAGGFYLHGVFD